MQGKSPIAANPWDTVRNLGERDERMASELLARTFRDNPINCALIGADSTHRLRANAAGMRASLAATRHVAVRLVGSATRDEHTIDGVLIGLAPGEYPTSSPPLFAQLRCFFVQGLRVANRWSEVFRQLDAVHPREPHAYLGILGVAVGKQGQGVGTRLLDDWLRGVDEVQVPGYLETDKEANLAFYQRAGFEVVDSMKIFGAQVWCLWREAQTSSR